MHDYEVDFVYVEHGTNKRELAKVRLCLRCAPSLYLAKMKDDAKSSTSSGSVEKKAPAIKARDAREKAARRHAASAADDAVLNSTRANVHAEGMADCGEGKEERSVSKQSHVRDEPERVSQSERSWRDDDGSGGRNSGSSNNNNHRHGRSHRSHRNNGRRGSKKKHPLGSSFSSSSSDCESDSSSSSSLDSQYASWMDSYSRLKETKTQK